MFENLGICKGPGTVLAQTQIGPNCVDISKVGECFNVLIDKRTVISARSEKDFIKRVLPIFSCVTKMMCANEQINTVQWKRLEHNYTKMLDTVLKGIQKNKRPADVFVLDIKPDEIQDNRTVGYQASDLSLEIYHDEIQRIGETIYKIKQASDILLKTCLEKDMWGSSKIMSIINRVKSGTASLSDDFANMDYCLESLEDGISKTRIMAGNNISATFLKSIVGKTIKNFAYLKSFISEIALTLYELYVIDTAFKKCVGYPATWFFDGTVYIDFLYEYDNLIGHLIKSASIETNIIEPLFVWKIKLTGVNNNV